MADIERGTAAGTTTGPLHHDKGRHGLGATNGTTGAGYGAGNYGAYGDNNYRRIANPHPLGILSFGATLFVYSLYSVHARGIHTPNVIVGMALFVGGLVQLLAGMWAFPRGSTFAATVYSLYGAFWISYAMILLPGTGIISSYGTTNELNDAVGIYFMIWMAITIILLLASLRRHITFLAFFVALTLFYMLHGAGYLKDSNNLYKAGGAFGIVASVITLYMGLAKLLESDHRALGKLPLGYLGARDGTATGANTAGRATY